MDAHTRNGRLIRFSIFELDCGSGELFKQGRKVKLQGQPFELLVALLDRPGEVLTREELRQKIWPSEVAGDFDQGLNRAINKVREALGDSAETPRFIETIPRRGHRFIGSTQAEPLAPAEVVSAPPSSEAAEAKPKPHQSLWILAGLVSALLIALIWLAFRRASTQPARELTEEQLTFNPSEKWVQSAAISPDGRYFVYSDTAGIHVRLLATNEERLIPRPPGVSAGAFWHVAAWLPDGTQMLVNVIEAGGQNSTWTVSVLGESARELRDGALGFAVSPDGKNVALTPREASSPAAEIREIWLMGIEGDSLRSIVSLPHGQFLYGVHWSPDGDRLAYVRAQQQRSGAFVWSIESCGLNGGARAVIVPKSDLVIDDFCWLSDGRIVYSRQASANTRRDNLYQITAESRTGNPATKPVRVADSTGAVQLLSLSATADSKRLVLQKVNRRARVYVAQVSAPGAGMSPPRPLTTDGSMFALARPGEPETHIRLLSLTGGADREITVKNFSNISSLDWAPDGTGFYAASSSSQGSTLFHVDVDGNSRLLWQQAGAWGNSILGWAIPSRYGRYLAINGAAISSNAWMVENF